jgi:hypothetical protein
MRRILAVAAFAAFIANPALALHLYPTEDAAKSHCKSGVVWINAKTMIYHMPGSKDYANTKEGAYVCQAAADKAGARPAMNGQ